MLSVLVAAANMKTLFLNTGANFALTVWRR